MLQLKNAEQDDHALEILASLFNKGYLLGFKTAVAERIESDIATLEFMKGNK
ncbi:hypothetical protein MKY96_33205 [Paenibacillus sp. FSL R7-0302]|uniref:hypothetical protein n=1 Tax=Paenibacillus sp. FSL R7-0302 TaxID=2921681 RepID=UPI0030FBD4F2